MRVAVVGALPESLLNFRGELLLKMVEEGHEVIAMANFASPEVVSKLEEMGVKFFPFPVQRNSLNPLADLKTFLYLRKTFREQKLDVVLAYTIKPIIWGGMALRRFPKTRFYALVTGLGFAFQSENMFRKCLVQLVTFLYKQALAEAKGVIFQNQDNKNEFVSHKIVSDVKCCIIRGSGVGLSHFAFLPITNKSCVFLAIGRLLREKGFREYAEAARLVKKRCPDAVFQLLGPEDPSPDGIPISEVQGWNREGWIEYCGTADDVRPVRTLVCSALGNPVAHGAAGFRSVLGRGGGIHAQGAGRAETTGRPGDTAGAAGFS